MGTHHVQYLTLDKSLQPPPPSHWPERNKTATQLQSTAER